MKISIKRLPVVYRGKALMPMKAVRVSKFLYEGKGRIRYDRKLKIHYLQLLVEPSDTKTQEITLGLDPGSVFDGISIVSSKYHHINIELIQRPKKGKNAIKAFKTRQAANRRVRRSRLRHRKVRFDNRTSKKLPPTIQANVDFRKWIIEKLMRIYPISKVVAEDVKYNHNQSKEQKKKKKVNEGSFSLVELGKTQLYKFILNLNLDLELYEGKNTHKLRVNSFFKDEKTQGINNKGVKDFNTHCLDSFVLACNKDFLINEDTGEILNNKDVYNDYQPVITNINDKDFKINKEVIFIEKIVKIKRCMDRVRAVYTSKENPYGGRYYRMLKGGIREYYHNFSNKSNICRVKIKGDHSNHPKLWIYINNGKAEKIKHEKANYGGTKMIDRNGNKKSFFKNGEWENRTLSYA